MKSSDLGIRDQSQRQTLPDGSLTRMAGMLGLLFLAAGCRMVGRPSDFQVLEPNTGTAASWDATQRAETMNVSQPLWEAQQVSQFGSPRELCKVTHPRYVVEPPDILLIEAVNSLRVPETPLRPGET
jgi:hypothetical protein